MSDLVGKSIGRYYLREQLGEGGMATVYKAYDTRLERDVAVKFIRKDAFPPIQLEVTLKRFEREAKALARLSHPNIVKIHDYGEYEDTPYLVEEYLPGGTLKQRLGKPMPWQEAVQLLLPVAHALEYAHRQGMVHRDVKPSNILITSEGTPMLTDFGIAKFLAGEETQNLTGTGVGIGTPEYMAPEQWTGALGPGLDIYSLGVVLYELVTGRKPYTADTPAAILLKQVNDPLPSPNQFVPDLPEAVDRFLLKTLAKKPEDRYQDMGEVVKALDGLLVVQPLQTRPLEKTISVQPVAGNMPSGLGQAVPVERPVEEAVEPPIPEVKGRALPRPAASKKRPWMITGGIAGITLLLIAGGIWGLVSLKKQAAPTPLAVVPSVAVMTDTSFPTMTTAPTLTSAHGLLPMSAADLATAPQAATLFEQDFEGGTPVFDNLWRNWSVVRENNGNHIYCNASSTNWQSFVFGSETWTDYLLQMRVEFSGQSVNQDQQVHALMRVNSNEDGYNAGLGNRGAWISYQPDNRVLANAPISAAANQWYIFQVAAYGSQLEFSIDGQLIGTASDTASLNGMLGFVVSPNTQACVDDIHVWALKSDGSFGPSMTTATTMTSVKMVLPVSAADLAAAPQAATLYEQDFEGGTITGLHGGGGNWSVVRENNGNHIYCNASSTNWQPLTFGNETWTDYLLQMRVEFLGQSVGQDQQVHALMRLNSNGDGYDAGLGNMGAWLNYQPGNRDLANASISAAANQWYTFQVAAYGSQLEFSIDYLLIGPAIDTTRSNGMPGFVDSPNTQACVDDIHVWALKSDGSFGP